jgi:uncharacterized protein (DUF433 family)
LRSREVEKPVTGSKNSATVRLTAWETRAIRISTLDRAVEANPAARPGARYHCPGSPVAGFTAGQVCKRPEESLHSTSMNIERLKRVTVQEGKCGGRPCIRGFRIRVSDVLDLLAAGASYEEILADYPFLEREDILAAIEYAARQADHIVLATS